VWCGKKSRNSVISLCETHYKWSKPHLPCKTEGCLNYKEKGHYCSGCKYRMNKYGSSLKVPPIKVRIRNRKIGISQDFISGMKMVDIMKKYQLTRGGVRYNLRRMGIRSKVQPSKMGQRDRKICSDYPSLDKKELMLKYRLSRTRINIILKRNKNV